MSAGFVDGVVHDRALMRRAQTGLALRWFAGYCLDEALPHHSSLTRIRQRWGAPRFKRILQRVVPDCVRAGLVKGDVVHVEPTLMRADLSWESLTTQHAKRVIAANAAPEEKDEELPRDAPGDMAPKPKKHSATDPEASMATPNRGHHLEISFNQHTAADDHSGIIVDVAVETGEANEGKQLLAQIARIEANTGLAVRTVTADGGYAHAANYAALEDTSCSAVIPSQRSCTRAPARNASPRAASNTIPATTA